MTEQTCFCTISHAHANRKCCGNHFQSQFHSISPLRWVDTDCREVASPLGNPIFSDDARRQSVWAPLVEMTEKLRPPPLFEGILKLSSETRRELLEI